MAENAHNHTARVVLRLSGVQVAALVAGLVTAPILARALGADGRGLIAALQAPVALAPILFSLGLGAYSIREAARGTPPAVLVGSLSVPLLIVGVAVAAGCYPLAQMLAHDKPEIVTYLAIGLALTPLSLVLGIGSDIHLGLERWNVIMLVRLLVPVSLLVAIVTLSIADALTVHSVAVVVLGNAVITLGVIGPLMTRFGRPRFSLQTMRDGLHFGMRAWPGTLASLANLRLDQLLMIPLVSARQLGLYAVAVTVSGIGGIASNQVQTAIFPRVAATGGAAVPQALRVALTMSLLSQTAVCVAAALLLVPLFGSEFEQALSLIFLLAPAAVMHTGASVLGFSLTALGRPGTPSIGEFAALAITVPGLVLLLPSMGATGAALISIVAYGVNFAVQVMAGRRELRLPVATLIFPRYADLLFLRSQVIEMARLRRTDRDANR